MVTVINDQKSADERESSDELSSYADERMLLVERITASPDFWRARQLCDILLYVTRFAINHPTGHLREHDIALNVLKRKNDFDPALDNIVRVQTVNLRRKLGKFFDGPGRSELYRIVIPRGTYVPQFIAWSAEAPPSTNPEPTGFPLPHTAPPFPFSTTAPEHEPETSPLPQSERVLASWLSTVHRPVLAFILLAVCGIAFLFARSWISKISIATSGLAKPLRDAATNPLITPMIRPGEPVNVVLPDISLMELETYLSRSVTVEEYISGDFPKILLDKITDPAEQRAVEMMSVKRATGMSESSSAQMISEQITAQGGKPVFRFARDLHVRDLRNGNWILFGNFRSDPWSTLFTDRTNFRYFEEGKQHYFLNVHPAPGEPARYVCGNSGLQTGPLDNYASVTLLPNLTNTGYVLIVNGADSFAIEAATQLILHSHLPGQVLASLPGRAPGRDATAGVELLLKGTHLLREMNSDFQVVSYRVLANTAQ